MIPRVRPWFALVAAMLAIAAAAQADPFLGTWALDRSRSEFNPPQNFQRRTLTIESGDEGTVYTTRTISDRLQATETRFAVREFGKDVPIDGSAFETVAVKRINNTTLERAGKIKNEVVETATLRLSADGRTLTMTTKGEVSGRAYSTTQVFSKQQ